MLKLQRVLKKKKTSSWVQKTEEKTLRRNDFKFITLGRHFK